MATVYITEYAGVGRSQIGGSYIQAPACPPVANQTVAIGGSSLQSAAFGASTTIIRVHADAVCSVAIGGTNPAATTASARLAAGVSEFYGVTPGDKLAVISNT